MGTESGRSLSASVKIEPTVVLEGAVMVDCGSPHPRCLVQVQAARLRELCFLPLAESVPIDLGIEVRTKGGYQSVPGQAQLRVMEAELRSNPGVFLPPIVVNSRRRWHFAPESEGSSAGRLELVDSASVVHDSVVAVATAEACPSRTVDLLVLLACSPEEEAQCHEVSRSAPNRANISESNDAPIVTTPPVAAASAVRVGTQWLQFQVASEPYTVLTGRGYAPVIDVRNLDTLEVCQLFVGARSLSNGLEQLRSQAAVTICGTNIALRKSSEDQYAQYEVKVLSGHSDVVCHDGTTRHK